jgi:hypothetical protein
VPSDPVLAALGERSYPAAWSPSGLEFPLIEESVGWLRWLATEVDWHDASKDHRSRSGRRERTAEVDNYRGERGRVVELSL